MKCKTSTTTSEIHKAFLNFLAVEVNRALKRQNSGVAEQFTSTVDKLSFQGTEIALRNNFPISSMLSEGGEFQATGSIKMRRLELSDVCCTIA
jgi:hypothetical protein